MKTKKPKLYICGAISYNPAKAKKDFQEIEDLYNNVFDIINPFELHHNHDKSWASYMRVCIPELLKADRIYVIENKHLYNSIGASLEILIALILKIKNISTRSHNFNKALYLVFVTAIIHNISLSDDFIFDKMVKKQLQPPPPTPPPPRIIRYHSSFKDSGLADWLKAAKRFCSKNPATKKYPLPNNNDLTQV